MAEASQRAASSLSDSCCLLDHCLRADNALCVCARLYVSSNVVYSCIYVCIYTVCTVCVCVWLFQVKNVRVRAWMLMYSSVCV